MQIRTRGLLAGKQGEKELSLSRGLINIAKPGKKNEGSAKTAVVNGLRELRVIWDAPYPFLTAVGLIVSGGPVDS